MNPTITRISRSALAGVLSLLAAAPFACAAKPEGEPLVSPEPRAFYGDYDVTVTHAGKSKTVRHKLAPGAAVQTITVPL